MPDFQGIDSIRQEIDGYTDDNTGYAVIISHKDIGINEGDFYFVKTYVNMTSSGATTYFGFSVPASTLVTHASFIVHANSEFEVTIYEGATYSSSGTNLTAQNCNRNSTSAATLAPVASPTLSSTGSVMWRAIIPGAYNGTGIHSDMNYNIVPKQNTNYVFEVVKQSSGTHYIDFDFYWTEG